MWVIVSSWRLRGYCRRKWPSLIQVALSIPLPDPRLALPRRSLALRPLFLSLSLLAAHLLAPLPPSALFAPSNQSFRLAFPSFIHDARHVALFSSPPFLHEDYSILRPILPLVEGRQRLETFLSVISSFFSSPLLDLLLFRILIRIRAFSRRIVCLGKKGRGGS